MQIHSEGHCFVFKMTYSKSQHSANLDQCGFLKIPSSCCIVRRKDLHSAAFGGKFLLFLYIFAECSIFLILFRTTVKGLAVYLHQIFSSFLKIDIRLSETRQVLYSISYHRSLKFFFKAKSIIEKTFALDFCPSCN